MISVLETAFTTEEAATILNTPERLALDAVESGHFEKSIVLGHRKSSAFSFHSYFDILEFKLKFHSFKFDLGSTDLSGAINEFLDYWAHFLDAYEHHLKGHQNLCDAAFQYFRVGSRVEQDLDLQLLGHLNISNVRCILDEDFAEVSFLATALEIFKAVSSLTEFELPNQNSRN